MSSWEQKYTKCCANAKPVPSTKDARSNKSKFVSNLYTSIVRVTATKFYRTTRRNVLMSVSLTPNGGTLITDNFETSLFSRKSRPKRYFSQDYISRPDNEYAWLTPPNSAMVGFPEPIIFTRAVVTVQLLDESLPNLTAWLTTGKQWILLVDITHLTSN